MFTEEDAIKELGEVVAPKIERLKSRGWHPASLEIVIGAETASRVRRDWWPELPPEVDMTDADFFHDRTLLGVSIVVDTSTPRLMAARVKIHVLLNARRRQA